MQKPGLYIVNSEKRGRCVHTALPIKKGDVIEICHIIEIPKSELSIIHKTVLHDYYFLWGHDLESCAIALGYGSLYNHQIHPNANFILDIEQKTIDIEAIKDIQAGEEVTLNYHGEPGDKKKLWFSLET